jgi:arginine kinase
MNEEERQKLDEDGFLFEKGDRYLEASGFNNDWPSGRGVFVNDEKTLLIWLNEEDQVKIISMQDGSDIQEVLNRLKSADKTIESSIEYDFDDKLGYLTACPTNLGTTMRLSLHV